MNRTTRDALGVLVMLSIVCVGVALAGEYAIDWHTVDGGGGTATGGDFELSGTIGQPDAGVMIGGSFALTGGFWFETPPGDCDGDGDVDLHDFELLEGCLTGPNGLVSDDCRCYDFDRNGSVDLADFEAFAASYTGP